MNYNYETNNSALTLLALWLLNISLAPGHANMIIGIGEILHLCDN